MFRLEVYGAVAKDITCPPDSLCLLCTHIDYIFKPALQLSDILSLSSGLYIWAEVIGTISRLAHKISLHNPL